MITTEKMLSPTKSNEKAMATTTSDTLTDSVPVSQRKNVKNVTISSHPYS